MPTVALHTLGCKLNHAETSAVGRQFIDRGFRVVDFGEPADVCLINTCTVTHRADRECRQLIRRALRTSPDACVIVTGCYAQLQPEEVASINGVDLVLGTAEKFELFRHAHTLEKRATPLIAVGEPEDGHPFGSAFSAIPGEQTRAFLKVQDGCDYSCSFCTIPQARGGSRSLPVDECVSQAESLVDQGYREIVLTGVNVGDYGRKEGGSLAGLLRALVRVGGLRRIRVSSIEPNLVTDELVELFAGQTAICPHFHIPLQSGDDRILRLMRRRYSTADYAGRVGRIRSMLPHAGIGADVIVGFPGETDDHFAATHAFLADLPISYLHVFTYSERPNTPAVTYGAPVEPRVRFARNDALRVLGQMKRREFLRSLVGTRQEVLAESEVRGDRRFGFTGNYARVSLPAGEAAENALVAAEITGLDGDHCSARVLEELP